MNKIISFQHISAAYEDREVLHDVCLDVYERDYLGIIGPNGGGKTTLMKILLGLKEPSAGTVAFFRDGQPVSRIAMGYLPQYSQIDRQFPISVGEVVLSGLNADKRWWQQFGPKHHAMVDETLRLLELSELKERPIGTLSGGQLQRVLLARAVVSQPEVVVLDEPNTYIDRRFQAQMYEMLSRINRQAAIIMVSHDIAATLHYARHVACVNHTLHYHDHTDVPTAELERHFLSM